MSSSFKITLSAAFWMLIVSPAHAADRPKLPDAPGKETTVRVCGSCHAAEMVMNRRESREGWSGVVEDMIRRGTKGTDEEFGEVVDYLVANFSKATPLPKVNVNKASAEDLALRLNLSSEQAAAIVDHRQSKGDFKSVEDVMKVPGIDTAAIAAKKNRLEF